MALTRLFLAALAAISFASFAASAEPTPIDKAIALQTSIAAAREHLTANQAIEAITILEQQLPFADGNRAFLDLLRSAYIARIKKLQVTAGDPNEITNLRTKLGLLGVTELPADIAAIPEPPTMAPSEAAVPVPAPTFTPPVAVATPAPAPPAAPTPAPAKASQATELLSQAATLFNEAKLEPAKFELAAQMFAAAFGQQVQMRDEQRAAWAYCRLRVAAEHLNKSGSDTQAAAKVVAEVEDALTIAPNNVALQKVGQELLAAARARAGSAAAVAADGWVVVETASFVIRHRGNAAIADAVAAAAEEKRGAIFARWSGPAGGAWSPKCVITLHPAAEQFATATKQHPTATGRATVHLHAGQVTERKIDLRADDASVTEDALPRELSHLILADLFPNQAPPRWAIEGMAVLAASAVEIDRYLRTFPRCQEAGELIPVATLMTLPAPPSDKVTGYYVGSVSLVDFLIRMKGDKAFTTFLRDSQRYGLESAMKRQYGYADAKQLEAAWMQAANTVSVRAQ